MAAVSVMASCSTPKYAYHFDKNDYNAGKKQQASNAVNAEIVDVDKNEMPFKVDPEMLTASTSKEVIVVSEVKKVEAREATKSYKEMSKAERKEFRKEAKSLMKTYIKATKSGDKVKAAEAAAAMDNDLKLAAIFGAVGIVALLIGGDVFWIIGGIALIIGVVFFVMWLVRQ
jgi:ABC-type transporter MlaC component